MNDVNNQSEHNNESNTTAEQRKTIRTEKYKKSLITRLNRVEGQVRGIKGMIEKDVYCDDILQQTAAVQSAINSISRLILESHMKSCVFERIQSGDNEVVDELMNTIGRML